MPCKIADHQCNAASEATGIEVIRVLVDDAPAFSSARILCLAIGNNLANTLDAFAQARFFTSSATAATALARQVVIVYSAICSRATSKSLSSSAENTVPHVCWKINREFDSRSE